MPWLRWTRVEIPIILRQKVHIVEDATGPVIVLHCLLEAHIEQHGPVKEVLTSLDNTGVSDSLMVLLIFCP